MSQYLTVEGEFTFPDKGKYDAAVARLQEGKWMDRDGYLLEETGGRRSDEADAVPDSLTINFPHGLYRNIGSTFDSFMAGTKGLLVWTCTDGMFHGGVIRDGQEKTFDLENWAKANTSPVIPDPATDFDKHVEWQNEVEEAFLESFE